MLRTIWNTNALINMDAEGDTKVDAPETNDSLKEEGCEREAIEAGGASVSDGEKPPDESVLSEQTENTPSAQEMETVQPSTAQDLRYMNVGGNFYTGIDVNSEDEIRRREERAKRFGPSQEPAQLSSEQEATVDVSKLEARSKRFGTEFLLVNGRPVKIVKSLPPVSEGVVRLTAVHLHGTDEMSTEDVLEFFSLYGPRNIEWINDQSCNAVWEDEVSARRALNGLGQRPLAVVKSESETSEEEGEKEEGKEALNEMRKEEETGGAEKKTDTEGEESSDVQWWLALPHAKAKQLFIRLATTGDMKASGAARRSQYYKKYGNPNTAEPEPVDLRDRLGRKRVHSGGSLGQVGEVVGEEEMEVEDSSSDPLATLVKRPRPMHADRDEEEEEKEEEGERGGGGEEGGGTDLRGLLKKKRKRRDLKMRLGSYPRLVEEHR